MKKYLLLITSLFCALTVFSQNSFPSAQGAPIIKLQHSSDGVNAYGTLQFHDVNSRMGYVGFGSSGNNIFHFSNETGGNFSFLNGKVGIGTTNPEEKLHVNGDLYLFGNKVDENNWGLTNFYWKGHTLRMGSKEGRYSHNRIELKPGGSDRGTLYSNIQMFNALDVGVHEQTVNISSYANHDSYINAGDFGIGTNNPKAKLHVNGNILASEVKVSTDANNVPDYVFKDDYKLTSLKDLENYIKENHHLPEIPSASEVEAEGLELAKMNLLLLKKIEELTLHTIEQEKKIGKQEKQISELTNIVLELYQNKTSNE